MEKDEKSLVPAIEIVQEVVRKIQAEEMTLPVLPNIVIEVEGLVNDPDSTIDALVKVIEQDAVISVSLIKLANSPIYRGAEVITRVAQAVPRLGMKEIRNIVSAIANKALYKTDDKAFSELMEKQWDHSLACAYCAVSIAKKMSFGDPEKYFLMGLVHDVGKVMLFRAVTEMSLKQDTIDISELMENMEVVHPNLGGILLKAWGFDRETVRSVVLHHKSGFSPSEKKGVFIVNLSDNIVNNLGYSLFEREQVNLSRLESFKNLGIDDEQLKVISEVVKRIMDNAAHLF